MAMAMARSRMATTLRVITVYVRAAFAAGAAVLIRRLWLTMAMAMAARVLLVNGGGSERALGERKPYVGLGYVCDTFDNLDFLRACGVKDRDDGLHGWAARLFALDLSNHQRHIRTEGRSLGQNRR